MRILSILITIAMFFLSISVAKSEYKPKKPECIAPAGAGGGWDLTCRLPAAKIMKELKLFDRNMRVTNIAGGGGGVAYASVVSKRSKNNDLIVAASMATATRLAQNLYSGYKAQDVRWIGTVGADFAVVAVKADSKYNSLQDLMNDIKKGVPVKVSGASSAGGWDHLKFLMIAKKAGIKDLSSINYISFVEGSSALIEVIAGRVEVFSGDTSEVIEQRKAGKVKVLGVISPNRINALQGVKTAKEQGYDVIAANWRGFFMPKDTSDEAYAYWVNAVRSVAVSNEWEKLREANGLAEFNVFGADFDKFVLEQIELSKSLAKEIGVLN